MTDISWYDGPRAALRPLLELADDSEQQLTSYLGSGRVLVAWDGEVPVGQALLLPAGPGAVELKSLSVLTNRHGQGTGAALVARAVAESTQEGYRRMTVSTGAADVGLLRFYQRVGFRMLSIERDAFLPETGYPDPIDVDGIRLRDRVWFDRQLP